MHRIIRHAFEYARGARPDEGLHGRQEQRDARRATRSGSACSRKSRGVPDDQADAHATSTRWRCSLVKDPGQFQVIVTNNLFGDIITDIGGALQGGLGMAASGNIHPGRDVALRAGARLGAAARGEERREPDGRDPVGGADARDPRLDGRGRARSKPPSNRRAGGQTTTDIGGTLGTREVGDWIAAAFAQDSEWTSSPSVGAWPDPLVTKDHRVMATMNVFILGGARTPMTEYIGALKDVSAIDLGAIAARGGVRADRRQAGVDRSRRLRQRACRRARDAIYGARHVGLKAGVPIEVPALTVNRLCGSGIQAAVSGAQLIQLGEADIVLSGGMESMSQAPHVIRGLRSGLKLSQGKLEDSLWEALLDPYCGCSWRRRPRTARRSTASRARSRTPTRSAASSPRRRRGPTASSRTKSCRSRSSRARASTLVEQRRSPAAGHDAGRPGEAAGGVQEGRQRHRRQRQRHRRRRRGADPRVGEQASRSTALTPLGAPRRVGDGRRRAVAAWAWARRRRRARRWSTRG